MKQRILVAVASIVLAALILLLLPSAHPPVGTTPSTTDPNIGVNPRPDQPMPPSSSLPDAQPGVVRLYSCDERIIDVFETLADQYAAKTGTQVVVLQPEQEGCQQTLQRYLESEDPPTVLCVHSQRQLLAWQDTLLDLKDTALAAALRNDGLALRVDNKLLGIPVALEGYGLLVNAQLLATKGALTRDDITDFSALTTAVQILKNNSAKAFATPSPELRDAWQLLMEEDLAGSRAFVDLYGANGVKSGDPITQFMTEKAVFLLGSTRDYDTLSAFAGATMNLRDLDILPTYAAGAMEYTCSTAWCVNASARQEDIDATLAFMAWMVTAANGQPAPVDQLKMLMPFADAAWYGNWLENKLLGYMKSEAAVIRLWGDMPGADRLLGALNSYLAERTDDQWEQLSLTVNMVRKEYLEIQQTEGE